MKQREWWTVAASTALILLSGLPGRSEARTKAAPSPTPAATDVLTQRYNTDRTGHNPNETQLTPANVNKDNFGKLFELEVDGQVYAQPLFVAGVQIGGRPRDVVLVATQHNSLFLFDADSGERLWWKNYGTPVPTPNADWNKNVGFYLDATPEVGILSTPVIDRETLTIYFTRFNWEPQTPISTATHWLHAVDLVNQSEKFGGPVPIQGSSQPVPGAHSHGEAPDPVMQEAYGLKFNPGQHLQRPALLLDRGRVLFGFGSHADQAYYQGWIFSFDARNLTRPPKVWSSLAGGPGETLNGAGIWQSGTGLASDGKGNYFVVTGNGDFNADVGYYADSVVKLADQSDGLKPTTFFTPCNQAYLASSDLDVGSSGALRIAQPDGRDLLVVGGKEGKLYLLDANQLGGYQAGGQKCVNTNILAEVQAGCPTSPMPPSGYASPCTSQPTSYAMRHIHGTPVFWRSRTYGVVVYVWTEDDYLRAFQIDEATRKFTTRPCKQPGPDVWDVGQPFSPAEIYRGMTGGMLSISSNQNTNGIVWATTPVNNDANQRIVPGILRAFAADNLRQELWNSNLVRERDDLGNYAKFTPPMVANGKVYVATFSNRVNVYGLHPKPATPVNNLVTNGDFENGTTGWSGSQGFQVNGRFPLFARNAGALCPTESSEVRVEQLIAGLEPGTYTLTAYANTNIMGGNVVPSSLYGGVMVGVHVAGSPNRTAQAADMAGYLRYTLTFDLTAKSDVTVWYYAPKVRGMYGFEGQPPMFALLDGVQLVRK